MQFRFDANQEFQVKAIEAVTELFDGQTRTQAFVRFKSGKPVLYLVSETKSSPKVDYQLVARASELR